MTDYNDPTDPWNAPNLVDFVSQKPEPRRPRIQKLGHSPFFTNGRPNDLQPMPTIDLARLAGKPIPQRDWIVEDLIPERSVAMLSGDGGEGKTLLCLQLAVACVLGKPWLGKATRRCRALGVFCEDDADELHRRLVPILDHYGASFEDIADDLMIMTRVGEDNLLVNFRDQYGPGEQTALYTRLNNFIHENEPGLIILDALHDFFGGNENSRPQARQFIGELRHWAMRTNGGIVVTAHPSVSGMQSGSGSSGNTGWNNAVRARMYFTSPRAQDEVPDLDYRELKMMKANYGPRGAKLPMRWKEGVFVLDGEAQRQATPDRFELDHVLMKAMRRFVTNGQLLNAAPNARTSFATSCKSLPSTKEISFQTIVGWTDRAIERSSVVRVTIKLHGQMRVCIRPADMRYAQEGAAEAAAAPTTAAPPDDEVAAD